MRDALITNISRRSFVVGGLALVGASAGPRPPGVAATATVVASAPLAGANVVVAAHKFMNAVGICTHPSWRKRLWGSTDWQSAFLETGVMHTRGKIGKGGPGRGALADLQKLFASGVKICVTVASEDGEFDYATTQSNIDFLSEHVDARHISGIESANEYNNPRHRPADWALRLRAFQKWLYETVRADRNLGRVPVVSPSIWGRLTQDYITLGNLEPNVDKACMHYYSGGRRPTTAGRPRNDDEGGSGDYSIADAIREASVLAPTKPMWITEYGYPIAGPGTPLSEHMITETAAAKYLVRGLLDAFGVGVEKIYIYSLIDDVQRSPPRYHGLLDGTLSRRQTFHAVKNLMGLFADSSASFTPGGLDYTLGNLAPTIKRQLFQKSNNTFLLTMYQDVDSYDRAAGRDTVVVPVSVGLTLAQPASRIEVFTPSISAGAVRNVTNVSALTIPVGDHVTVVRILPT